MNDTEPTRFKLRQELFAAFREALSDERETVDLTADQLLRRVTGESDSAQYRTTCCDVMRAVFNPERGDLLLQSHGCDGQLTIRYVIPRTEWGTWR